MISLMIACLLFVNKFQQEPTRVEYKVITAVEVVRNIGWSRSGIVSQNGKIIQEEIKKDVQENYIFKSAESRKTIFKADSANFISLTTFRSGGELNYNNIALNDAIITNKINEMTDSGWVLDFVATDIESSEEGFILTRYYFKKEF